MADAQFFTHPVAEWQRRCEALRTCFVDRQPAQIVAMTALGVLYRSDG